MTPKKLATKPSNAPKKPAPRPPNPEPPRKPRRTSLNLAGGFGGWVWLAVIILPIYYVVITSLKHRAGFYSINAFLPPLDPTLDSYKLVLENDFLRYLMNSAIITVGSVIPALILSLMASYALVRGRGKFISVCNTVFIMGLALPIQAAIIPIYYMITRMHLYDTLLGMVLPYVAFAIPISILILNNFMRDIPNDLFESMRLDGCSEWGVLWRLALPLTRPALVTVGIYDGLQVWNGFMFPLILTQSPQVRVLPLSLWTYQGEFTVNIPAILAAVVLSTLPLVILYIFGRRQMVSGIAAGFSK